MKTLANASVFWYTYRKILMKENLLMYLKSVRIKNFRKFRESKNIISFVPAADFNEEQGDINEKNEVIDIASKTTLIVGKNNSGKTTIVTALKKLI
ncbi:TPA: AAA family ATPase, partial [Streptococcus suis]